jgi:hypothetical protein
LIEYAPAGLSKKLLIRCHSGSRVEQVAYGSGHGRATAQLTSYGHRCSGEPFDRGWPFRLGHADRRIRLGDWRGHAHRWPDQPSQD